jgi:ABC-type Fe3+ transport system substrate-binding protein
MMSFFGRMFASLQWVPAFFVAGLLSVSASAADRELIDAAKKEGQLTWYTTQIANQFARPDAEGYWFATNVYFHTPAFNTELVPRGTEPRTFSDLLDPKWKGKMAWAAHGTTSGAAGFIGIVLTEMGEEKGRKYLGELAKQSIAPLNGSARAIVDQVMSGEYPIALQVFNHQPVISAGQGAPVDWIPMNPAMGIFSVTAVIKDAPHPNAAKLFAEFLASSEGQQLFRDRDYIPADPSVPPRTPSLRPDGTTFRAVFFTPEQLHTLLPEWSSTFLKVFR